MVSVRDVHLYRSDAAASGQFLTPAEREAMIAKYLPNPEEINASPALAAPTKLKTTKSTRSRRKPIRTFIKTQIYLLTFLTIQLFFGLYIRARRLFRALKSILLQILYHHHRTPELIKRDVAALSRLPKHLSVILTLQDAESNARKREKSLGGLGGRQRRTLKRNRRDELVPAEALDALLDEVAELAAWSVAVGIPLLSIYEPTGCLKNCIPGAHEVVRARFRSYFGEARVPSLQMRAPHVPSYLNGDDDEHYNESERTGKHYEYDSTSPGSEDEILGAGAGHLDILLLSEEDGRATMVDLTKTLVEMSQKGKISPRDVGLELIDAELEESFSAGGPDLLMLFGDRVVLQGYPPWQLRLTEIYCAGEGSGNGGGVDYVTWLRGLYRFAKAEMRFGR